MDTPSAEIPTDKRFAVLCEITRAQHFAWREAVAALGMDARQAVLRMWEVTGRETGSSFAARIDPGLPVAPQIAAQIVFSSACMGEHAAVETRGDQVFVRHTSCPWLRWHDRRDLRDECRAGCDRWFDSTVSAVNDKLGTQLRVTTLETLPEGASSCLRCIS